MSELPLLPSCARLAAQCLVLQGGSAHHSALEPVVNPPWLCRCITDIANECATDHGGCWHAEYKIKGQSRAFSACKDNLPAYKVGACNGLL